MKNISQRTAIVALVVGVLSIPALVFASTALLDSDNAADETVRAVSVAQIAKPIVAAEPTTTAAPATTATEPPAVIAADIDTACGEEGLELVDRETAETITELEQAALDALRPICLEAGLALPDAAVPPAIVLVETVVSPPKVTTTAPPAGGDGVTGDDSDHDDDYDEDDDHDDEDYDEDDDHDEDEDDDDEDHDDEDDDDHEDDD